MSDVCPQNGLYHDRCDDIITSQMAISEMVDNNNCKNGNFPLFIHHLSALIHYYPSKIMENHDKNDVNDDVLSAF